MADRVSASISIGGSLDRDKLLDLAAIVNAEGLSTDWDGEDITLSQLPSDAALTLMAHEVAWGRFDALEEFCVAEGLPFARWSGFYAGQWGAERVVFVGVREPASYVTDEEDRVLLDRPTVDRLATIEGIRDYFAAADFSVPPFRAS